MERLAPDASLRPALRLAAVSVGVLVLLKAGAAYLPHSRSDMKGLNAAIGELAPPGTPVRLYEEEKLFGLEFYRRGDLERVSRSGQEAWADRGLADALARLRAAPRTQLWITNRGAAAALDSALTADGIPFRRTRVQRREVYLLDAPA